MKFLSAAFYIQSIKKYVLTVYYTARDPRTSWPVKFLAFATMAYVVSPIDFVPDFIPLGGIIDDLIIAPISSGVVMSMVSSEVKQGAEQRAEKFSVNLSRFILIVLLVIIAWVLMLWGFAAWVFFRLF